MNEMRNMFKQILCFVGISGIGWLLDFSAYTVLSYTVCSLFTSNIISSFIGVTFVFIFASHKLFKNNGKMSLKAKYIVYLLYQCMLIYVISMLLVEINDVIMQFTLSYDFETISNIVAKIAVTPMTMLCNFIVMKILVEKL